MEIVKKNLVSIICGVVALAAVAVAFVILPSRQSDLQAKLDASKKTHDTLNGLLTKQRQLPSADPDHPEQATLSSFPSPKIIDQGDEIMKKVQAESTAIVNAAVKMNKHELLTPGSLPTPTTGTAILFRQAYMREMPLINPQLPATVLGLRFAKDLKAGVLLSQTEITTKQQQLTDELRKKLTMYSGGTAVNQVQVDAQVAQQVAALPKQELTKIAEKSKIYIDPNTFEMYAPIAGAAGAPQASDIYWAQLSYWIQSDVVAAINYANRDSKSVKESPVKHLIYFRSGLIGPQGQPQSTGQAMPAFIAIPGQAGGDPDAEIKPNFQISPTGRHSNGLYDVFHFTICADVEAAKVGDFLRALGYQRFVTPLYADVKAVDNALEQGKGYMYGETPMLNITVPCEILYLRKWNEPYLPTQIKTLLGITATAPAQPTANAAP